MDNGELATRELSAVLDDCGLRSYADVLTENLTNPQKKKLAFATAIIGNTTVLVLEHPFDSDPVTNAQMRDWILQLERKMTVFITDQREKDMSVFSPTVLSVTEEGIEEVTADVAL